MSEIGIIGQIYEDRRTKKTGKLIERDEKYKTLLFESPDGKTFNTSYGTFKSNYRKYESAGEQTTEVEKIEEVAETEHKVVEVTEESVKKPRKKRAEAELSELYVSTTMCLLAYAESFKNPAVQIKSIPKKNINYIKAGRRRIVDVTSRLRDDTYIVCMSEEMYTKIKDFKYIDNQKFHENWHLKMCFTVPVERFDDFLESCRDYIINFMCEQNL